MNTNKTCYIVGAGDFAAELFCPKVDDYIISADGGYNHLSKIDCIPNCHVGDNDSISDIPPDFLEAYHYPSEKDDTDIGLALQRAFDLGYRKIKLFGAYGDRPDHFYANLQHLLAYTKKSCEISIIDNGFTVFGLYNANLHFQKTTAGAVVSIFTDSAAFGVRVKGLKYPLEDFCLTANFPLGVSNESTGTKAEFSVKEGTLLIFSYDKLANSQYFFSKGENK